MNRKETAKQVIQGFFKKSTADQQSELFEILKRVEDADLMEINQEINQTVKSLPTKGLVAFSYLVMILSFITVSL